jgi:hypothetical protein
VKKMAFYEDMQAVAAEVLAEFKQGTVNYIKITPGAGPVDNPGQPVRTPYAINSAVSGVAASYVAKGLAIGTDLQVIAPVDSRYVPEMTGSVEVDGVPHKITQILPKPAAGTPVVYVLIIQRGK